MKSINADHRPWPLPSGPWIMKQTWETLLFAHWEMEPSVMQNLVPPELQLDTFDGKAWIAVVPFQMSGIRFRGLPPIPGTSAFPELNVRTYVTHQGKPGVYFFSLDAANPLAVAAAHRFFHLPYFNARMNVSRTSDTLSYDSFRIHKSAPAAEFRGNYAPSSQVYRTVPGSLESWLVERYCLYTVYGGRVYRGEIHHESWPLQRAEAAISLNTMTRPHSISLPSTQPLLHYARKLDVFIWPLKRC